MADASNIGANFSNYEGNAALGGGSLGAFTLDTRPLQDFARYTMLYNREEQARKQKEAEKAAEELGKIADYDLTTSIPKDAKVLQEKYDKLIAYVKENPGALQFKNRDQWIEFQKRKNELANDIRGAKVRNILNLSREKEIADTKDEIDKKRMRQELDKEIAAKDIRTPIFYTQQYDLTVPDFGKNAGQSVQVNRRLPNEIFQETTEIFDAAEADRKGAAIGLGIDFDETTITGQGRDAKFKENIYVKGAEILNSVIKTAKAGSEQLDPKAQQDLIRSKVAGVGLARDMLGAVDRYNNYVADINRMFTPQELLASGINPNAYAPINWQDELSPAEYAKVAQFIAWEGNKKETKVIQTNEKIEQDRLGVQWYNARTGRIQEDRLAKAAGVTEDMALSAKKYAEALVAKLNGLKGADGIIHKSELSKLTSDELKFLGVANTEENKFTLNPLDLKNVSSFVIDDDGTIRVFSGGTRQSLGAQKGSSINVATIATNKLGDEMITTTGKEGYNFNNLIPLYQSATAPRTTTTEPKQQQPSIPTGTRDEFKKAGWSEAQIKEGIKRGLIKVQ